MDCFWCFSGLDELVYGKLVECWVFEAERLEILYMNVMGRPFLYTVILCEPGHYSCKMPCCGHEIVNRKEMIH